MKAVMVVKMKEGYLILPYAGDLVGVDPTNGRAVERAGYDSSGIGKAVEAIFREEDERIMPTPAPIPPAPEVKDDIPF